MIHADSRSSSLMVDPLHSKQDPFSYCSLRPCSLLRPTSSSQLLALCLISRVIAGAFFISADPVSPAPLYLSARRRGPGLSGRHRLRRPPISTPCFIHSRSGSPTVLFSFGADIKPFQPCRRIPFSASPDQMTNPLSFWCRWRRPVPGRWTSSSSALTARRHMSCRVRAPKHSAPFRPISRPRRRHSAARWIKPPRSAMFMHDIACRTLRLTGAAAVRHDRASTLMVKNAPCEKSEWESILTSLLRQEPLRDIQATAAVQSESSISISVKRRVQSITVGDPAPAGNLFSVARRTDRTR